MTGHAVHTRRSFLTGGAAAPPARDAISISEVCLARAGIVCQTCGDACPERAIRFPLRRGGPPLPVVEEDACTRCGACAPVCPVAAIDLPERAA